MARAQQNDWPRKAYDFIVYCITVKGVPPTNREIGEALGISSTGHINHILTILENQNLITRLPRTSRGIRLTTNPTGIQVIGTIAAGVPLDIFSNQQEVLSVEYSQATGDDVYALRVKGNSMIEDAICDGDYVIIKRQTVCHSGEIIVATHLQEGVSGAATLKRFFLEQDDVRLQPANSEMKPILIPQHEWDAEWRVQGRVIAVVRQYLL